MRALLRTTITCLVPVLGLAKADQVFRDAATDETLAERVKIAVDPIAELKPIVVEEPEVELERCAPGSIIDRSEILNARGQVTLVPKRAVIHLPERLKANIGKPSGSFKLINWPDFYQVNRAWIDTVEVTRAQAEGRAPLSEELIKSFEKRTNVVVAVMRGGPISVLPLEVPASDEASTETATIDTP